MKFSEIDFTRNGIYLDRAKWATLNKVQYLTIKGGLGYWSRVLGEFNSYQAWSVEINKNSFPDADMIEVKLTDFEKACYRL